MRPGDPKREMKGISGLRKLAGEVDKMLLSKKLDFVTSHRLLHEPALDFVVVLNHCASARDCSAA